MSVRLVPLFPHMTSTWSFFQWIRIDAWIKKKKGYSEWNMTQLKITIGSAAVQGKYILQNSRVLSRRNSVVEMHLISGQKPKEQITLESCPLWVVPTGQWSLADYWGTQQQFDFCPLSRVRKAQVINHKYSDLAAAEKRHSEW